MTNAPTMVSSIEKRASLTAPTKPPYTHGSQLMCNSMNDCPTLSSQGEATAPPYAHANKTPGYCSASALGPVGRF